MEINSYLAEPYCSRNTNIVEWWADHMAVYSSLGHLAKTYLCVPATQTTSERLFSTCGQIVTSDRAQLLTEHVEEIAFLHENDFKTLYK